MGNSHETELLPFDEPSLAKKLDYPIPWMAIIRDGLRSAKSRTASEWGRRTLWGKFEMTATAFTIGLLGIVVVPMAILLAILIAPNILLIPILDAISRISPYVPETPDTYKDEA